jgi:hypothetical protein
MVDIPHAFDHRRERILREALDHIRLAGINVTMDIIFFHLSGPLSIRWFILDITCFRIRYPIDSAKANFSAKLASIAKSINLSGKR